MELTKRKIVRKKRPADVELIKKLVDESGIPVYRIEKEVGVGRGLLLRGLQPDTKIKLPPKWETPIIKYLKKKIAEKQDVELQTEEIKLEMGFSIPEKESDLKEDLKEVKRKWIESLNV